MTTFYCKPHTHFSYLVRQEFGHEWKQLTRSEREEPVLIRFQALNNPIVDKTFIWNVLLHIFSPALLLDFCNLAHCDCRKSFDKAMNFLKPQCEIFIAIEDFHCRSQMNLYMLRTRQDVSMERRHERVH